MANRKRKFIVQDGSTTLFDGYEYGVTTPDSVYLTELTGWDDFDAVDISTEPKLIGAGSYVVYKRINERVVTAKFNVNSETNVTAWLHSVKASMINFNLITLSRVSYDPVTLSEKRKEVLTGYINSVKWDRLDDNSDIEVAFKCVNPIKDLYLNGSSTKETTGVL